mgnify:CR=1 FL=1
MESKSLFIEFMGDSPQIKVLDFLLTEKNIDFSISDLARNSKIGRATLYRVWGDLIKNKLIIKTREIGKAKLYKLNTKNPFVEKLIELDNSLVLKDLKSRIEVSLHKRLEDHGYEEIKMRSKR